MKGLKGKTIYLRALEPEDAPLLYEWENDTSIWHLGNTLAPYSMNTIVKFIEADDDIFVTRQLRMMVCLNNHKAIGAIDLFDFTPQHLRAGIGILIADKTQRKKGYGAEALDLLIDYAFNQLQLKQLYCNILESNSASLKLFESKNFKICGTKKDWLKINNKWNSEHLLQLISPD